MERLRQLVFNRFSILKIDLVGMRSVCRENLLNLPIDVIGTPALSSIATPGPIFPACIERGHLSSCRSEDTHSPLENPNILELSVHQKGSQSHTSSYQQFIPALRPPRIIPFARAFSKILSIPHSLHKASVFLVFPPPHKSRLGLGEKIRYRSERLK